MKLYVLKLQQGKYYIGKTNKPIEERYEEHLRGLGSAWTKKYPPVGIHYQVNTSDPFQETSETLKCMKKYGIENVRGGAYSRVSLTNAELNSINQIIRSSNDQCMCCGRTGHFINNCNVSTHVDRSITIDNSDDVQRFSRGRIGNGRNTPITYGRGIGGGRSSSGGGQRSSFNNGHGGHRQRTCDVQCYRCGLRGHFATTCNVSTSYCGRIVGDRSSSGGGQCNSYTNGNGDRQISCVVQCHRCGLTGHLASTCNVTTSYGGRIGGAQWSSGGSRRRSYNEYTDGDENEYGGDCGGRNSYGGRGRNSYSGFGNCRNQSSYRGGGDSRSRGRYTDSHNRGRGRGRGR